MRKENSARRHIVKITTENLDSVISNMSSQVIYSPISHTVSQWTMVANPDEALSED